MQSALAPRLASFPPSDAPAASTHPTPRPVTAESVTAPQTVWRLPAGAMGAAPTRWNHWIGRLRRLRARWRRALASRRAPRIDR